MGLHFTAWSRAGATLLTPMLVAACAGPAPIPSRPATSAPVTPSIAAPATPVPQPPITSPSSKYYADDGPPLVMPGNLDAIPDAVPKLEPLHRFANRPYTVLGRDYVPATMLRPYRERGIASWYGRKFHGQKTSIGEIYDMFAMTAAHPTLPLPSYVRVTNVMNGRSVVVRVNDRGPFLHGRVIDLSYAAAHRLDVASRGSGEVVVEALLPDEATPSVARLPAVAKSETDAVARPPVVAEAAQKETGFVVQLGAFANFANAQAFVSHVGNQMQAAQVEPRVRQSQGLWRVYVGPYAGREEARRVADRIASAFGLPASVSAQ